MKRSVPRPISTVHAYFAPHRYSYGVRMTDMMDDAPSMPKFNNAMARDELRDELAGKDLSDFVLVAHPDPFTFGEKPARESLAGAKYLDRGAGEPLVDVYAPLCPARFGPGMVPDVSVNFDEAWTELEEMHREGNTLSPRLASSDRLAEAESS